MGEADVALFAAKEKGTNLPLEGRSKSRQRFRVEVFTREREVSLPKTASRF
jgi:hypothetical protein